MADFTGKKIKDTYTRVVQYHNGTLKDGLGFAISASVGSISGSLSGSFEGHFSGTFDGATSSSFASRIATQESFSSSLDATYASDADLNLVSSSVDSLNAATSSYALAANISGSNVILSSSLANRITSQESFSSSLDATFATDADVSTAVSSLNSATSSYALSANISGSFTELSSSIATRITGNDTDISNLQSFSSSLDATFATDADLNLISSSVDSINAATSSYIDNTSVQSIGGAKTFTDNVIVNSGASLTITDGDITSTHTSSSISQNYYRIQLRGEPLAVSQSHSVRANISAQGLSDGGTFANIYGTRVDVGVFNNKSGSNTVNIGNSSSGSVTVLGSDLIRLESSEFLRISAGTQINMTGSLKHRGNTYLTPTVVTGTASTSTILTGSIYEDTHMILASFSGSTGTHTLTLPDATTTINTYRNIRFITDGTVDDQHQIDIEPSGSQTLDGSGSAFTMDRSYEGVMIWSDGTEWIQIQAKNV